MTYAPYRKATLLIPFNDAPHLFVVMNDPDADGLCLLIMLTSIKAGKSSDKTCSLDAGCHPFVQHPTFALYRLADHSPAVHISNMVEKKYYVPKDDVSQALYDQIRDGMYASDETKSRIINYGQRLGI